MTSVEAMRLSRFVLSGYKGFIHKTYKDRQETLSRITTPHSSSTLSTKLNIAERNNAAALELESNICTFPPTVLEKTYPKFQNKKHWAIFIVPKILNKILDSRILPHEDFMQLRELISNKNGGYNSSVLQAAILIGDFNRAGMQAEKRKKDSIAKEGWLHNANENLNLKLHISKTGKLEVSASPFGNEDLPASRKIITTCKPTSYEGSKHLFLLGCLEAIGSFKVFTPEEEQKIHELVLREKPFSRAALQIAIFLNETFNSFANIPTKTLSDLSYEKGFYTISETTIKDPLENNANLHFSIHSDSLQLLISPIEQETSFHERIVQDEPMFKTPLYKTRVLKSIVDTFEYIDPLDRFRKEVMGLLKI